MSSYNKMWNFWIATASAIGLVIGDLIVSMLTYHILYIQRILAYNGIKWEPPTV